ncbi:MAG: DUF3383 domain-containing protein [Clostridia bacterium]|nr:DUF3383 domain-containing protein [Clostridia bacterium]
MSYLDQIVRVNIDLTAPAADGASFDSILLMGAIPTHFISGNDWARETAYNVGDYAVNETRLYRCTTAGTSGSTAPTALSKTIDSVVDGTVKWQYVGTPTADWTASSNYTVGTYVRSGSKVYLCIGAGTSGTVAPTAENASVSDGTVLWAYQAPPAKVGCYGSWSEVKAAGWEEDPVGRAAAVAFAQSPKPAQIYIAVQQIADGATESLTTTLNRAVQTPGWYMLCPAGLPENQFTDLAAWTETQYKLLAYPVFSDNTVVDDNYYRSLGIFVKTSWGQADSEVPESNLYLHIAYAAKCLNYEPGSETWAFKTLAGGQSAGLASSEIAVLNEANLNCYVQCGGQKITLGGKVRAGEWIDVLRFRDWLQNEMQKEIYNLFLTNPKIPYTDQGIGLVKNRMLAVLQKGQEKGGIAENEYDELDNLLPGYTVTVPLAADLSGTDRASRQLTGCRWQARLAGAIQAVEISGVLGYE